MITTILSVILQFLIFLNLVLIGVLIGRTQERKYILEKLRTCPHFKETDYSDPLNVKYYVKYEVVDFEKIFKF